MLETKRLTIVILLLLTQALGTAAEDITVTVKVQNRPPLLFLQDLALTDDSIHLSFSVEDPNTLADLQEVAVFIYETGEIGLTNQKFIWKGIGTDWFPKPQVSFFPPPELSRERRFVFLLEVKRKQQGEVFILIEACDQGYCETRIEIQN